MSEYQSHWIHMDKELEKISHSSSNTELREKNFVTKYLKDIGGKTLSPKIIQQRLDDGRSIRVYIWMDSVLGNVALVSGKDTEPSLKYLITEDQHYQEDDVDMIIPRRRQSDLLSVSIPVEFPHTESIQITQKPQTRTKRKNVSNKTQPRKHSVRSNKSLVKTEPIGFVDNFKQFSRDRRFHNPIRKVRKNPLVNDFGLAEYLPNYKESLALSKFISLPVVKSKVSLSPNELSVVWESPTLKSKGYELAIVYKLSTNGDELSLRYSLRAKDKSGLDLEAILDGEDIEDWNSAYDTIYLSSHPLVMTKIQQYIENPEDYKADDETKMVATTNYPTLEELEDGEGIVKEEEPEEIIVKKDDDPQIFENAYEMKSKEFIHKETEEIVTQVPIMELDMYEEYTGQNFSPKKEELQSPLPFLEQLKLLSSRSLLSSSDSKFLKKALKERIERDFGKAVANRIKLSVQNKMTGSTKASLMVQGKCEKNEDRLAVAKCLRTLGYQSTFSMEDGVGTLESGYLQILEYYDGLDGEQAYLGSTYVYPLEHKIYADITDEIDLNFDQCLSMIESVLNKNKPIEEKIEEKQTDMGLNEPVPESQFKLGEQVAILFDDLNILKGEITDIDPFNSHSLKQFYKIKTENGIANFSDPNDDYTIVADDGSYPIELEIFEDEPTGEDIVQYFAIEGNYDTWQEYISNVDNAIEMNFYHKGNIKLRTDQYDYLVSNLNTDLNNSDKIRIPISLLGHVLMQMTTKLDKNFEGKILSVTVFDPDYGIDQELSYENMFMIYADGRRPFYFVPTLNSSRIKDFIIEYPNKDWNPVYDVVGESSQSEDSLSLLRQMLKDTYQLSFTDSEWFEISQDILGLEQVIFSVYFDKEYKASYDGIQIEDYHKEIFEPYISAIIDKYGSIEQGIFSSIVEMLNNVLDPSLNQKGFLIHGFDSGHVFFTKVASILYSNFANSSFPFQQGMEIYVKRKSDGQVSPMLIQKVIRDLGYGIPVYEITASYLDGEPQVINFSHYPDLDNNNQQPYKIVGMPKEIEAYDDWFFIKIQNKIIEVSPKANLQEKFVFKWESNAHLFSAMKAILEGTKYNLGNLKIDGNELSQVHKGKENEAKIKESYIPYFVDGVLKKANLSFTSSDGTTYGVIKDSEPVFITPKVSTPSFPSPSFKKSYTVKELYIILEDLNISKNESFGALVIQDNDLYKNGIPVYLVYLKLISKDILEYAKSSSKFIFYILTDLNPSQKIDDEFKDLADKFGQIYIPKDAIEKTQVAPKKQPVEEEPKVVLTEVAEKKKEQKPKEIITTLSALEQAKNGSVFYIPNANEYESNVAFKLDDELFILDEDGFALAEEINTSIFNDLGGKFIFSDMKTRTELADIALDADKGFELISDVVLKSA